MLHYFVLADKSSFALELGRIAHSDSMPLGVTAAQLPAAQLVVQNRVLKRGEFRFKIWFRQSSVCGVCVCLMKTVKHLFAARSMRTSMGTELWEASERLLAAHAPK